MAELSERMEVCNLLGVFYEHRGRLMVSDEVDGTQDVEQVLGALHEPTAHVLVHHRPPEPPSPDLWGAGCCFFEATGKCHAGHHNHPQWIYSFNAVGALDITSWLVTDAKGTKHPIRIDWLVGHRSQIVVVSIPDFEKMAEKMRSLDPNNLQDAKLGDLQARASEIRDYLEEINKLKETL